MAYKKKGSNSGESNPPSEPSKETKQPEESNFEHPVITSFSMMRQAGGWVVVTIKSQGDVVISKEFTSPELKAITFERFRIMVSNALVRE